VGPEPMCMQWPCSYRDSNADPPARRLVTVLTELPRLLSVPFLVVSRSTLAEDNSLESIS